MDWDNISYHISVGSSGGVDVQKKGWRGTQCHDHGNCAASCLSSSHDRRGGDDNPLRAHHLTPVQMLIIVPLQGDYLRGMEVFTMECRVHSKSLYNAAACPLLDHVCQRQSFHPVCCWGFNNEVYTLSRASSSFWSNRAAQRALL